MPCNFSGCGLVFTYPAASTERQLQMAVMALHSTGYCHGVVKGKPSCSVSSSSFSGQTMQVFSVRRRVSFAPAAFPSVRASTAEAPAKAPADAPPTHPSAVTGASPHKAGAFIPAQHRWMYEGIEKRGPDEWNRTWYPKAKDHLNVEKKWYIVDAAGKRLGRLASTIAIYIRGKDLPTYTPSVDMGAYVIVINAEQVGVTGNKRTQKIYRRHSGRPGGMKEETFDHLQKRIPERIVEHAVRGMLPKGRLGRRLFTHLKVFKGPEHPHSAQKPEELPIHDKRINLASD